MPRFGFVGASYSSQSLNADAQSTINWYPEIDESQAGNAPIVLYPTPGLEAFANLDPVVFTQVRGVFSVTGRTFAVCGTKFVEVFSNGTFTQWGTVGNDALPVTMAASPQQLLLASAGTAYVFDLGMGTLTEIPGGTFSGPASIAGICDDFFIIVIGQSKEFYVSAPLNANDWVTNGSAIVSVFPDNIIGMLVDHREIWFWSDTQSVVYYDSGNIFPFDVVPGGFIEAGIAAKSSPVQMNNTVYWLGADARGTCVVWGGYGYTPQRVSNHAIEFAMQGYSRVDDAVGFTYQDQGHQFYVLYFPTPSKTWVFDGITNLWHERGFWLTSIGQFRAAHYWNHTFNFGKHLVGDWQSGKIYEMHIPLQTGATWRFADDDGNPIRRVRRAPHISAEQKFQFFSELQVYVEAGVGPQPPLLKSTGSVVEEAAGAGASVSGGAGETAWTAPNNIASNTPGTYATVGNAVESVSANNQQLAFKANGITFPITQIADNSGNPGVWATITASGFSEDQLAGANTITVTGFANSANNGTFAFLDVISSTQMVVVCTCVPETHAATGVSNTGHGPSWTVSVTATGSAINVGDTAFIQVNGRDPFGIPGTPTTIASVEDDKGNTWSPVAPIQQVQSNRGFIQMWSAVMGTAIPLTQTLNVTVNEDNSGNPCDMVVLAFQNFAGVGSLIGSVQNAGPDSVTWSSGMLNLSAPAFLLSYTYARESLASGPSGYTVPQASTWGTDGANNSQAEYSTGGPGSVTDTSWTQNSDDEFASTLAAFSLPSAAATSELLEATDFGISLPSGSSILGIAAQVNGKQSTQVSGAYLGIALIGAATPHALFQLPLTDGSKTEGDPTDLWGTSAFTQAQIEASGFGFAIQAAMPATHEVGFSVSGVELFVWYLAPGTSIASLARGPALTLRWSNDGAHTWSNEYTKHCGQTGEYKKRVRWLRMGQARDRVYELSASDPVGYRIIDAYLESTPGTGV